MKCLYRWLAVAILLLWTDHMAGAQEDQYNPPLLEIPEDVDIAAAMAQIGEVLKGMGMKALDTVMVLGLKEEGESLVTFANKMRRDAAAQAKSCNIPADAPDNRPPGDPDKGKRCNPNAPITDPTACQPTEPRLLIPICDPATGTLIEWYAGFTDTDPPLSNPREPFKLTYKGSPATHLTCGNNQGGTRPCK